jgi:hypothetical protein
MHVATRVRTWLVASLYRNNVLYSEIALSREHFGIRHMYVYSFLLRMTDTMTCQSTVLSSWDTLYAHYSKSYFKKVQYYKLTPI